LATQLPTTHLSTLSLHDALPISPLGTSGAREAEIVEELALEFQESYERALRNGLTAGEAWLEVQKRSPSWGQLAGELRSALEERSEEHTSELQSRFDLVCRLLLE